MNWLAKSISWILFDSEYFFSELTTNSSDSIFFFVFAFDENQKHFFLFEINLIIDLSLHSKQIEIFIYKKSALKSIAKIIGKQQKTEQTNNKYFLEEDEVRNVWNSFVNAK